jgi:hypothetical protein
VKKSELAMISGAAGPLDSFAMKHVRYLAETIGPRGSATPQEALAAEYAGQAMEEAGLQPVKETFSSVRSLWRPYALVAGLALAAEVLMWMAWPLGAGLAFLLMVVALGLALLELTLRPHPLRQLFPRGESQNVWARIPAARAVQQRVLLIAHLDTHRTPKMLSSLRWLQLFQWLAPLGLVALTMNALIFFIGIFDDWEGWRTLSLLPFMVIWWLFVLMIEADSTPYTAGANDNASGVGVALSLAARLKAQPLPGTEVWVVCTGCKEVGGMGAADFVTRHRDELLAPKHEHAGVSEGDQADAPAGDAGVPSPLGGAAACLVLDAVGTPGTGPCYLSHEALLTTVKSDPHLLRRADELAAQHPELSARRTSIWGGFTEGQVAAGAGLRVLTFTSLRKDGSVPHWHQPSDVYANVDGLVVQNTEAFVWELLWALDGSQPPLAPLEDEDSSEGG